MKYALYTLSLLLISIVIGRLLAGLITPERKKRRLLGGIIALCIILMAAFAYMLPYQKATPEALQFCYSDDSVEFSEGKITKTSFILFKSSQKTSSAVIIYPGAKVDSKAYAGLARKIAEEGNDVYIIKMPFHFALFNSRAALDIINAGDYESVFLAGHSLGGVMAASLYSSEPERFAGLILLASYPSKPLDQSSSMLSIYGENDGVLNMEAYQKARTNWPDDSREIVISGGNHCQFAHYGFQKGDNPAAITARQQIAQSASAIIQFIIEHN